MDIVSALKSFLSRVDRRGSRQRPLQSRDQSQAKRYNVLENRRNPAEHERSRLAWWACPPDPSPPEGGDDLMLKSALIAAGLAVAMTTGANALTINNKSAQEISIGLDQGDKETVHKIAAGKSVTFKSECDDHCGVTGPWNYSWWAKTGDTIDTDGKSLTSAKDDAS
jgi:hypothetical protein